MPTTIDRNALRTNQAAIVLLVALAFLIDQPWLVVFVGAVLTLGTITPALALFQRLYHNVLRPAGLLAPDPHAEDPAPHRFAQGVGAAFLIAASLALFGGATVLGWTLALIVVALAAINLIFGFCAGCFVYFHLNRLRGVS